MISDVFGFEPVFAAIGGVSCLLRFNFKALYALEKKYGTLRDALDALNSGSSDAVLDFVCAACPGFRLDGPASGGFDFGEVCGKVYEALLGCFSDPDGTDSPSGNRATDWDGVYFIARYRLLMSDGEFWDCTPRRFDKLHRMWLEERGIKMKQDIYTGDFSF